MSGVSICYNYIFLFVYFLFTKWIFFCVFWCKIYPCTGYFIISAPKLSQILWAGFLIWDEKSGSLILRRSYFCPYFSEWEIIFVNFLLVILYFLFMSSFSFCIDKKSNKNDVFLRKAWQVTSISTMETDGVSKAIYDPYLLTKTVIPMDWIHNFLLKKKVSASLATYTTYSSHKLKNNTVQCTMYFYKKN